MFVDFYLDNDVDIKNFSSKSTFVPREIFSC